MVDRPAAGEWDWEPPFPYGFPAAIDSAGSVAAPFLAGFSLTLLALILPDASKFRWGGIALLLLAAAAVCFAATVQCAFWAKQYVVTPDDIEMWRPTYPKERQVALQRLHQGAFLTWAVRTNRCYRTGIALVLLGMAAALVPKDSIGFVRALTIGVLLLGLLAELLWIAAGWLLKGSKNFVYDDRPDEPAPGTELRGLRCWPPLRTVARFFIPLTRLQRPAR